ncbi:Cof-type HAD-IIB family hydrolase [Enterococcus sp. DIV0187]|uniref:Cof-type HAD-IIB family hydrolase n=1 Tax=Enterococcus sp. DIV0187 TaxID=2774644 RepID=UPI003F21B328
MERISRFKLAAFDMDGTTLNSHHQLSMNTIESINRFSEKNVKIVFATGRMENAVEKHLEYIKSDGLVITHNGGLIKNLKTGEILSRKTVPSNIVEEIFSFSQKKNSILHVNRDNGVFIQNNNVWSTQYAKELGIEMSILPSTSLPMEEPISMLLIDDKNKLDDYLEEMTTYYKDQFDYVFIPWIEGKWMLQFLAPNTSKGQAVIELSHLLGINPDKEVISFGDSYNDFEMIAGTYFGVAMNNACKELKEVAKYVTKSNDEDGVAFVLDELVMNEDRFLCDL